MKPSRQRQPTFLWQGVLILLPVVVLAGAAIISLRQDRILARHEATERAQTLAEESANAIWAKLAAKESLDQFKDHTFRVDAAGQLIFPPPAQLLPLPLLLDSSKLNAAQQANWRALQQIETAGVSGDTIIEAAQAFIAGLPPAPFAAIARYRLAQRLAGRGRDADAAAEFAAVRDRFPEARGESGLPLRPLAEFAALELAARNGASNADSAIALNAFCSNTVNQPTFLTAHLLTRARAVEATLGAGSIVEPWQREWARREPLRLLAEAALKEWAHAAASEEDPSRTIKPSLRVPALSWFDAPDLSPNPQPVFPHGSAVNLTIGSPRPSARTIASITATGEVLPQAAELFPSWVQRPAGVGLPEHTPRQWLAARVADGTGGYAIVCRVMGYVAGDRNSTIGSPAWLELRGSLPPLPPWLGATIELAGVPLLGSNDLQVVNYETLSKGGGQALKKTRASGPVEVLATAFRNENGIERLRVNIHLSSPELLFGRQRTRSYLFGLLVAASAVAALVGFVSARRAFIRQQQLSAMKSNFVSSVSHELRAPIASVRLLAESLERGRIAEPAKQNEYFRFIVQECRRLSSLIENVLDFARIEQGRKQYEFEPADVAALSGKTIQLLQPVASEKQVSLRLQLPGNGEGALPPAVMDAAAIQQALVNLLDNAVKHAPVGSEVTLGIDWNAREDAGNEDASVFRLWVQDYGRGVPAAEHERIFERFYRPGSEMRRETQGVGIGLSIVKHIVEAHRGRVWVESEVGQGSRFIIELPAAGPHGMTNGQ